MEDPNDTSTWDIVKATQYGIFDRCKEIIERDGFDVRKPDKDNITVLHWAAINNRKDLVKYYLSAGAIIDAIGGDLNSTPLQWAVRQGHQSMIALLISNGAGKKIFSISHTYLYIKIQPYAMVKAQPLFILQLNMDFGQFVRIWWQKVLILIVTIQMVLLPLCGQ